MAETDVLCVAAAVVDLKAMVTAEVDSRFAQFVLWKDLSALD
jgi:hypothetical protein